MTVVEKSVLIEHTQTQMFALVDRVEDYPNFLPWCGGSLVTERSDSVTVARIEIAYGGIRSYFCTRNTKEYPGSMRIHLTEGPFTRMEGHWRFTALGETACKIEFRLHYEFSSQVLSRLIGPVFSPIADNMVESFVSRARIVYA